MTDATHLRIVIAKAVDPEAWLDDMPVPTRADVVSFHAKRQSSIALADAMIAMIGDQIAQYLDGAIAHRSGEQK